MICERCGRHLINAIDTEGRKLILVDDAELYGPVWGHIDEIQKGDILYEKVRPLLGARRKHDNVCSEPF